MVLCNRYIFLAHFGKIKKKILGQFFLQSLKKPEITSNLPLTSIFLAKNGQNRIFLRVKKWSYVIDNFCWHILGKFKKIPRNSFFSKSQKPQNYVKYGIFGPFRGSPPLIRRKLKKATVWRLSPYWAPTSYQISKKSLERFLRYAVTDVRTDARTEAIL